MGIDISTTYFLLGVEAQLLDVVFKGKQMLKISLEWELRIVCLDILLAFFQFCLFLIIFTFKISKRKYTFSFQILKKEPLKGYYLEISESVQNMI